MKRLIINGDDFGLSDGISLGIVHCMSNGCVSSTTIMPCVDGAFNRIRQLRLQFSGSIGVHLQLTSGKPRCSPAGIRSLLDGNTFPSNIPNIDNINIDEVEHEWTAQIESILDLGIPISHLDSHHGFHRFDRFIDVYVRLARRFNLAARGGSREICKYLSNNKVVTTDLCDSRWLHGELTVGRFLQLVSDDFSQLDNNGTIEIVTHPGYVDKDLHTITRYAEQRIQELNVLCSKDLRDGLKQDGIELLSFCELKCN